MHCTPDAAPRRASANLNPDGRISRAGSSSIKPETANKEEARGGLRGPRRTHADRYLQPSVWRPGPEVCGCSPTRASPGPGLDAGSAQRRGSSRRTAGSPARTRTKKTAVPDGPRGCDAPARPAARTRPLPAHHSAPRADTARGVAEPNRRGASAPGSPWPHCSERGDTRPAPRGLRQCAASGCGTQAANPRASQRQQPAGSSRPTLTGRACAVTSGGGPRVGEPAARAQGQRLAVRRRAGRGREGAGRGGCDASAAAAASGVAVGRCTALSPVLQGRALK